MILRITFEAGLWDQKAKEKRKWVRWKGKALSMGSLEVRLLERREEEYMNKAGRRGGTMRHSAARKSFKGLGKNCWFDVPKGYFTACFFASYPDIFSGKQNDVKKQTNKKRPGMVAKFKREKKGKKGQLGQRERKIRRSTNKEALGEENSE